MARRPRGRRGCVWVILALLLVLALIAVALLVVSDREDIPGPDLTPPVLDEDPRAQPAECPDVELVSIPGTWESAPDDDPYNPQANPESLLLTMTQPLQEQFPDERLRVYTVPYVAQFRNPELPEDVPYDESRADGMEEASAHLAATHEYCPYTTFMLVGFSQGAVIAGDLTSDIGQGRGPVPEANVATSVLIADGRREPALAQSPGLPPENGLGMEIALAPASGLTQLIAGATMTGPRPGGFGEMDDRTVDICDAHDHICNAPHNLVDGAARIGDFLANAAAHAQYATNPNVIEGTTVPEWVIGHLAGIVDETEEVPHL